MSKLLKDPAKALEQVKKLHKQLQDIHRDHFPSELNAADFDLETSLFYHITKAEHACMDVWNRLVQLKKPKSDLGCKVRKDLAA